VRREWKKSQTWTSVTQIFEPDLSYSGMALQHSLPGFAPLKVFVADLNLFVYPCCGRARAASICILP